MNTYSHILIIGGGLAGLTCAIDLATENIPVTLIEKNSYPRHKVCGEYISNEVLPYFKSLHINLEELRPVQISEFMISTTNGNTIHSKLPLGGFGISRFTLDHYLWQKAKSLNVQLINDQVVDVQYDQNQFVVKTDTNTFTSKYVIGAYGKRSLVDKTLNRKFMLKKSPWLAVKAHYKGDLEENKVQLHNFEGGYCGLSKVENDVINACYLVSYESFRKHKSLKIFQEKVMSKNKYLYHFFNNTELLFEKPITISQVNFDKKQPVENHIFMLGDAAGLIHPLCGNGMAMAIQGAQIISDLLKKDYSSQTPVPRKQIEKLYVKKWNASFSKRLLAGRVLQHVLLNKNAQTISYHIAKTMPWVVPKIIKQTHGESLVC
ncbi:NAD(P)/FAD-dependent oxidoreductase [Aquimarina gracilis]|uniref:NAD(P)/FAD-dependent oxidoreductase n=1 Tax=Aquimarina gracilis TaxID=874422 RepID=A0ABU5ZX15_9FLAO|nr:NAD(P)/FAD-dependent oxidoreductase [Aquimarina gracilis]MEB3346401.1 NAD(P)/FAD-dependent oxidoreductase [Aquimarina gracilis]